MTTRRALGLWGLLLISVAAVAYAQGVRIEPGKLQIEGVTTIRAANNRGLVITRASADAGLTVASTGGSGLGYALTSTSAGELRLQHDADGDPRLALFGATGSAELVGSAEFTFNAFASGVANTTYYQSAEAQPGFLAYNSANDTGAVGGATIDFDTEVYDDGGDFSGDTFTAPVAGRYLLSASVGLSNVSGGNLDVGVYIDTTASVGYSIGHMDTLPNGDRTMISGSIIVDMSASDTAIVRLYLGSGSVTVMGSTLDPAPSAAVSVTWFSGRLLP